MSNLTLMYYLGLCMTKPSIKHSTMAFTLVNVPFVLPLCLFILRLGLQRWRSRATISHTDFFTYNVVVVQLLSIAGSCLLTMNIIVFHFLLVVIGFFMLLVSYSAIIVLQIFTCLERYLAVVHPVTYLSLKSQTWTLIRNISCAFVWLQCLIQTFGLLESKDSVGYFCFYLFGLSLSFLIVLYCNLHVLCVLVRPRPGDGARGNKTKQRALHLISAITGMLMLKFSGDLLSLFGTLFVYEKDGVDKSCVLYFSVNWFTLPSTLVLPLLFLQRNGKLASFKTKT